MSRKKVLIIEDELLIAEDIKQYLTQKGYEVVDIAISYETAIKILKNQLVDIVLLDIVLYGTKSGFEIANYINKHIHIPFIYLTSHTDREFLEKAKETAPKAYLSKPIQKESLFATLEMATFLPNEQNSKIVINDGKISHYIDKNEIVLIKSDHVYLKVYLENIDKPLVTRNTIKNMLINLSGSGFISPHRSYIVNIEKIEFIDKSDLIINKTRIPISRSQKQAILQVLKE
ncbi:MAG: response regulator [Flavobacteriales bacterium]|jgi:DNA-binding LytR/AlgR family response regulator|nr:response regulator [Flavobacteriales bacterium]